MNQVCETIGLSNINVVESLIEINNIMNVEEPPEIFETLIEDISKLRPKIDSGRESERDLMMLEDGCV